MRQQAVTWILSAIFLAGASLAQAQDTASEVTGTVMDRRDVAVTRAQVRFEGPATYVSRTNSQGKFLLKRIPKGTYRVIVKYRGRVQTFTVTVNNGISPDPLIVNW